MTDLVKRLGGLALAATLFVAGCGEEQCITQTTQYTTSFNAVGYGGATQGVPVARFELTQDFVSHTPYEACREGPLQDVGVVRATVTNISTVPLLLEFDVQGLTAAGTMAWDHIARVERIMPKETVDLGDVGVTPIHVDVGAKVVLTNVAVLP